MLILCTDAIQVASVGDRLRLTVPSGSGTVELDLSLHQALLLSEMTRRVTNEAMLVGFASPPATVLRFPKPGKARRA